MKLGAFRKEQEVELQTATREVVRGTMCGSVEIRVEGSRVVHSEALFVDMNPAGGEYEPLLGYIPLEQCGAAVDLLGHRLAPVLKRAARSSPIRSRHGPRDR